MNDDTQQVASSLTEPQLNAMAYIAEHGGAAEVDKRTLNALLRKGLVIDGPGGQFAVLPDAMYLLDPEVKIEEPAEPPGPIEDDVPDYALKSPQHARMVKLARDYRKNDGHSTKLILAQIAGRCSNSGITAPSLEMVESWLPSSE